MGQSCCNSSLPRLYSLGIRLQKIKVIILKMYECLRIEEWEQLWDGQWCLRSCLVGLQNF